APKPLAKAAADSSVVAPQSAAASRFATTAKAVESAALVRDKPMPAAVAIAPAPITGTSALRNYLFREAAKFEPEEGQQFLNGTVRLRFMVEADGKLSNLQVVRGMRADYDEEALRLVCEGPAWRPGVAGGRRTALPVELTVSF
ncbi:TonB family protein, partial [Hymenobacter agri]